MRLLPLIALLIALPAFADIKSPPVSTGGLTPITGPAVMCVVSGTAIPGACPLGATLSLFDVTKYGAKCDGVTDDTTAINNAFAAARTAYAAQASYYTAKILFPAQTMCVVTGSVNSTGFTNQYNAVLVEGQNAVIFASGSFTGPVIDAMGSKGMRFSNLVAEAYTGTQTYGIQIGRVATSSDNGGRYMYFDNFVSQGSYATAACYNFAGEGVTWLKSQCQNSNTATSYGRIDDGANHWNIQSAFVTITATVDQYTSFTDNVTFSGNMEGNSAGGAALWTENASEYRFYDVYAFNGGTSSQCITLWATAADGLATNYGPSRNANYDIHCEAAGLKQIFYITGPHTGGAYFTATPTLKSLTYNTDYVFAGTSIFAIDATAGITGVTVNDLNMQITGGPTTVPFTAFDVGCKYTVSGHGYFYSSAIWNGCYTSPFISDSAGVVLNSSSQFSNLQFPAGINSSGLFQNNGITMSSPGQTINETLTTGTVTSTYVNRLNGPTLTDSAGAVTLTNVYTLDIEPPVCGTNVTCGTIGSLRLGGKLQVNGLITAAAGLGVSGNVTLGGSAATIVMQSPVISSGGTPFGIASGTGACATSSTLHGGTQAGDFACTGTTGASTATLALAATTTAYTCWGRDVTTPTTVTQTGSKSTTSVTLTLTSVTANDVIQFGCLGY